MIDFSLAKFLAIEKNDDFLFKYQRGRKRFESTSKTLSTELVALASAKIIV